MPGLSGALVFLTAAACWSQSTAIPSRPAAGPTLVAAHRSVFVSDPTVGKDPFFPKSNRRAGQVATPAPTPAPVPVVNPGEVPWQGFKLKGVALSAGRRLAIINNYTLAEGESREFRINNQAYNVRCVTVKEESAVISVKGRSKELSLREGL